MSMQLPKYIFFDMDDTILADSLMSDRCWREVCDRFSSLLGNTSSNTMLETIREIRRGFLSDGARKLRGGLNLRNSRREVIAAALSLRGIDDDALAETMTEAYMELKSVIVEPFPGALDTLYKLREAGVRLALITNGIAQEQRSKIETAELQSFFEFILIEGEFGIGKPDPRVFRHTLGQMNARPEETWMVGDNLVGDVGGAQAVGIHSILVDWRGSKMPADSQVQPDRTVRTITELVI